MRYLVNRADSSGGIDPADLERALGRVPEHRVVSDGRLVVQSNNEGVPVRAREPDRPDQPGRQPGRRRAAQRRPHGGLRRAELTAVMPDPRPIGVFDSGVGGLTVLREILRRSPAESTIYLGDNARAPYGVRSDDEVLAFSSQSLDALAERDVKAIVVACNTSTAVGIGALRRRYDLPILGVIRPGASAAALATRNRRVGVIATPATIRSHAYFTAIKDENPAVEVYEHATPALVPLVEAGRLSGHRGRGGGGRGARAAARRARRRRRVHLPAAARRAIDTLLLGCTHYPLLRAVIAGQVGERIAIVDSATATASALAELLSVNGLEAPGSADGEARAVQPASHVQLTTGDAEAFHALASRLFGVGLSRTSSRSTSASPPDDQANGQRASRGRDRSIGRVATDRPVVARRPGLAGRVPHRVRARRPRRPSPAGMPSAPPGAGWSTGPRSSASRSGRLAARTRHADPAELRADGARLRGGHGADRAGAQRGARDPAAGRRRAGRRRRSRRLGPGQHRRRSRR